MRWFCILLTGLWAQGTSSVELIPPEYDFGTVEQGTVVKALFKVKNTGKTYIHIQDIKPACGCTVVSWEKAPISPGAESSITVSFNTAGKIGRQRKSIVVFTDASSSPHTFILYGEVKGELPGY
ncbi:MAG: DUF1573 domain-containing protein [Bacteroidia bacterium]